MLFRSLLYVPLYYGFLRGLRLYDLHLRARVEALPIVKSIKGWDAFQKYKAKYERWLA